MASFRATPSCAAAGPLLLLTLLFLLLGVVLSGYYVLPYLAQVYSMHPSELEPGQRA